MTSSKWKEVAVSEVAHIIGGGTPKTKVEKYWNGNIPWISIADFNNEYRHIFTTEKTITKEGLENSPTKMLNKGDIIISARGTVGALSQLAAPMAFNQSCYGIRAKENVCNDFLYYSLRNIIGQIKSNTHGSVFSTITKSTFDKLSIKVPSIKQQKAIVNILSYLDDKIEINNKINNNLEQMSHALFKNWFIDFEPFKSSGFEDSELGKIPKGWKVGQIKDFVVKMRNGGTPSRNKSIYWQNKDIPWIKTGEIKNKPIIKSEEYISLEGLKNSAAKVIPLYSVLIAMYGATAGKVSLLAFDASTNQACCAMTCDSKNKAIYLYLHLLDKQSFIESLAVGAAQQNLNKETISKLKIIIPPDEIINSSFLSSMYDMYIENLKQNDIISNIRDTVLPKLMSGEVTVHY